MCPTLVLISHLGTTVFVFLGDEISNGKLLLPLQTAIADSHSFRYYYQLV